MSLGTQVLSIVAHAGKGAPKKEVKSRKSQKGGTMQFGAPAAPSVVDTYKPPSLGQRMKETANYAKLDATRDWVAGKISTKKHAQAHARANEVITNTSRFSKGKR